MRSACLCVCMWIPPIVGRQRLGIHVTMATNTRNEEWLDGSFSKRSVSYRRRVSGSLCVPCAVKLRLSCPSGCIPIRFLKFHTLLNIPVPEGQTGTAKEPSKPEKKIVIAALKYSVSHDLPPLSSLYSFLSVLCAPYRCKVNTFPRQRKIAGGVVFYSFRVISKENRRLNLPRTSC
jgi:hypothetical protein